MKLPWVSREALDYAKQEAREWSRLCSDMNAREVETSRRYDALLEKYHALKVAGAAAPPAPAQPREVDAVTQAIIAMSRGRPLLYQHYATYVTKARALGVDDETIAKAIIEGEPDDQGVPL